MILSDFDRKMQNGVAFIPAKRRFLWQRSLFIGESPDSLCLVLLQSKGSQARNIVPIKAGKKGRITIPEGFSYLAGFTGMVTFVGGGTYLEIWRKEDWDKRDKEKDEIAIEKIRIITGQPC